MSDKHKKAWEAVVRSAKENGYVDVTKGFGTTDEGDEIEAIIAKDEECKRLWEIVGKTGKEILEENAALRARLTLAEKVVEAAKFYVHNPQESDEDIWDQNELWVGLVDALSAYGKEEG